MAKNNVDKRTLELLSKIQQQKAEIAEVEKPAYKTNNSLPLTQFGKADGINLHTLNTVGPLIQLAGGMLQKADSYAAAVDKLGIENPPPFMWAGFSLNDWLHDLRLHISRIRIKETRAQLEQYETRLNAIVSPELRRELELKAISKGLTGI